MHLGIPLLTSQPTPPLLAPNPPPSSRSFFDQISQDTGKFVFGVKDTMACLEMGAVETLIIWEDLPVTRYQFTNPSTGGWPGGASGWGGWMWHEWVCEAFGGSRMLVCAASAFNVCPSACGRPRGTPAIEAHEVVWEWHHSTPPYKHPGYKPPHAEARCARRRLGAGATEIKFLNKEQEADTQNFKDKASGADLDVVDKVRRGWRAIKGGGQNWSEGFNWVEGWFHFRNFDLGFSPSRWDSP